MGKLLWKLRLGILFAYHKNPLWKEDNTNLKKCLVIQLLLQKKIDLEPHSLFLLGSCLFVNKWTFWGYQTWGDVYVYYFRAKFHRKYPIYMYYMWVKVESKEHHLGRKEFYTHLNAVLPTLSKLKIDIQYIWTLEFYVKSILVKLEPQKMHIRVLQAF